MTNGMAEPLLVNGRSYRQPSQPTVVFTIDGGDPRYLDNALARGLMPELAGLLAAGGAYARGRGCMPSLTNPNNLSIVTGVPPSRHGVPGNHYLDPSGEEVQLTDPAFLRAQTIHAAFRSTGRRVLMVTAKDKLRRLLGSGRVPSISAECADQFGLPAFEIADVPRLLGRPNPGIYDWDLSHYAMEIGLAVHRRVGLDLLYVSLTDYVQHKQAPGGDLVDRFFGDFDTLLGQYLSEGFAVGITADHGMNAKPRVIYLEDVLAQAGVAAYRVVLPITDPYVVHHGALGSFAWVHLPADQLERARVALAAVEGIEEIYGRDEAAVLYEHPADRIGDLSIASDAQTALGKSRAKHDLSGITMGLRSHGGRHEQIVPVIVSRPLAGAYAARLQAGVQNSDIHDLLLNG
ncbi:MAG: alkaline phosphatase family protein [Chloroflexi bacterium]|nr:alkaline phosphatase family protein [Chloroflexota bacterium]